MPQLPFCRMACNSDPKGPCHECALHQPKQALFQTGTCAALRPGPSSRLLGICALYPRMFSKHTCAALHRESRSRMSGIHDELVAGWGKGHVDGGCFAPIRGHQQDLHAHTNASALPPSEVTSSSCRYTSTHQPCPHQRSPARPGCTHQRISLSPIRGHQQDLQVHTNASAFPPSEVTQTHQPSPHQKSHKRISLALIRGQANASALLPSEVTQSHELCSHRGHQQDLQAHTPTHQPCSDLRSPARPAGSHRHITRAHT
eukprot:1146041-Pelagomonas_calceolata.AAC.24